MVIQKPPVERVEVSNGIGTAKPNIDHKMFGRRKFDTKV
jgi:hypothetical protein